MRIREGSCKLKSEVSFKRGVYDLESSLTKTDVPILAWPGTELTFSESESNFEFDEEVTMNVTLDKLLNLKAVACLMLCVVSPKVICLYRKCRGSLDFLYNGSKNPTLVVRASVLRHLVLKCSSVAPQFGVASPLVRSVLLAFSGSASLSEVLAVTRK